ncbi:TPA: hypothetical protein QDZ34_001992 [Stenotrophomonas maltophilia]|nr:hypothetical protein [Stenotrophomonas maltophilia]HDS1026744.1 hypothetical protein [Stenotrophomonas maltophilia]HDS1030740.1 hypothetical protein [Stenotrophomonas maltophilia]HDS1034641.1 hypothetical protein [Stenotrophomonas maltophilia]
MHGRFIWKRCLRMAVILVLAGIVSMSAAWWRPGAPRIGPMSAVLGTAQMQAEVMALAVRKVRGPPPRIRPPLLPHMAPARLSLPAMHTAGAGRPPPPPKAARDAAVPALVRVMEETLPFCRDGVVVVQCQDSRPIVLSPDDAPWEVFELRQGLEHQLAAANVRPMPVPARVLAGAAGISPRQLSDLQVQRVPGCSESYDAPEIQIVHLTRPVFTVDGQWAMIAAISSTCFDRRGLREKFTLHREGGRWVVQSVEWGGGVGTGRQAWPRLF